MPHFVDVPNSYGVSVFLAEYTIFYEEIKFGPAEKEELTTVPGNQPWAMLHLAPFRNYTFYVQARNIQGKSELSRPSVSHITKSAGKEAHSAN